MLAHHPRAGKQFFLTKNYWYWNSDLYDKLVRADRWSTDDGCIANGNDDDGVDLAKTKLGKR